MTPLRCLAVCAVFAASLAPAVTAQAVDAPVPVGHAPTVVGADPAHDVSGNAPVRVQLVLSAHGPQSAGAATSFLQQHGFTGAHLSADQRLVEADGTPAAVEAAFGTRLAPYRDRSTGRTFRTNTAAPSLPASLAGQVQAIHGLSDRPAVRRAAVAHENTGPGSGYTPDQIKGLYNLHAGVLGSTDGSGTTIGLLEFTTYSLQHIKSYDMTYYAPTAQPMMPQVVPVPGHAVDSTCCVNQVESELDIEVIQAIAPQATIKVYETDNTPAGENAAYSQMVSDGVNVISTSWGMCEQLTQLQDPSEIATLHSIFQDATNRGITTYAATGDTGAFDCRNPANPHDPTNPYNDTQAVDSPASDPNVVAVGGTTLYNTGTFVQYSRETGWSGSGGGVSVVHGAPAWQGTTGIASAMRQVPDVAFDGNPSSGISICTYPSGATNPLDPCTLTVVGGTSAGSPAWAAFNALYDQYSAGLGGTALGPAANLYSANACHGSLAPFHDAVSGNNGAYTATTGFDLVTGLGSMNGADLASAIHGQATASVMVSSVTPHAVPYSGGATVTLAGCGFQAGATINIGGTNYPTTWINSTILRAVVPQHVPGDVAVSVSNPGGAPVAVPGGLHYARGAGHQQMVTNRDGRLEMFVTGADGNVYHNWEPYPSGPLGSYASLGGPSAGSFRNDPAAGLNPDGRIEAFAIGTDGTVWHAWQFAPGSGWTSFYPLGRGSSPLQGVVAVATNTDGRLETFARGADGQVWHAWQTSPNGGWGAWYPLGTAGSGAFVSDVAAGRNGDGRLEISATDAAGRVWHAWQTSPSGGWTSVFYPLSGRQVTGTPGINTNQDGRLEIFAQAQDDNSIVHTWQLTPSGGWGGWYSLGGRVASDTNVARNSDGRLEVFANDLDGNLVHTWQVAPGSGWVGPFSLFQPTERLAGVPQTGTNTDGRVQAVVPGLSGTEWQITQVTAGGGWSGWSSLPGRVLSY
ncbi:MAG: protease pro-enzyme activation domain-containing protein [Candidatus Dormibacteria bacterium]